MRFTDTLWFSLAENHEEVFRFGLHLLVNRVGLSFRPTQFSPAGEKRLMNPHFPRLLSFPNQRSFSTFSLTAAKDLP
jgi:hypothetical protein